MSIIQSIRDKAAPVVIAVIAISLIGFILMDAGRSGMGGNVSPQDAVGEINGESISYEQFMGKIKQTEQIYEMNGRVVDENTRQQIYGDTWRSMIESELLNQEYNKLGLVVSDKEFNDMLFGKNPPEFLKQQFVNAETGEYDVVAAKQAISQLKKAQGNPNKDMINQFYLDPMIESALRGKYFSLVQNSVYVPKWMAEKTIADNSQQASFSYVVVPYGSIPDSTVKVSDADIMNYLKAHEKEYKVEEKTRSISYVSFPFLPSAQDTADVLKSLNDLKAEFEATTDPGAFVTRNASSLPYYDGYNSKARIQIAQKDSIIGAGVGKVYGPYFDVRSYVLSRVVDVKTLPDSVKARHILVATIDPRTQQPVRDDSTAKKRMDSIEAQIKGGASFDALAITLSDDEGSKMKGGDLGYFANGTMVKEFNDFCFNKKKGERGVVRTQFGYHLIEVTDQKDFAQAYKIAYLAKPIDASQATINEASNKASIFSGNSRTVATFNDNATKNNYNKLIAQDIKENDFMVNGLGVNRLLVKDIFKADVGDVLDPVEIDGQFVVVAITGEEKAGLPSVTKARPMVETLVRNQMKAKQIAAKIGTPASLEAAATALGVGVQRADSISFVSPMIQGAGYELRAAGFGFNKAAQGKISKPIEGSSGVLLVKPEALYAKQDPTATVEGTQVNLSNQQKGSILYSSLDAMRKAAKITDKRSKFL